MKERPNKKEEVTLVANPSSLPETLQHSFLTARANKTFYVYHFDQIKIGFVVAAMIRSIFLLALSLMARGANGEACTLCAKGAEPQAVQTPRTQTQTTCPMLENTLANLGAADSESNECKDLNLLAYQVGCCPEPPYEYCDICPDGSPIERSNRVPLGFAYDPTCAEIQYRPSTLVGLFEAGTCEDTFLRRGAHYCGCPGETQECFLCPDGAEPGNPNRQEGLVFNSNCRGIMYTFSVFKEDECTDVTQLFGFDAAAFCECPNYEPQTDYVCSLCDEGERVANPNNVWTTASDTIQLTCAQAEEFAQYFTRKGSCTDRLAPAREACCVSGALSFGLVLSFVMAGTLMINNLFW